jgi:endonuclease G
LPALLRGLERHVLPRHINNVRPGFDLEFLGTAIEFPELPGVGDELPYLHFSVVINPARRLPWYVAYNIEPQTEKPQRENVWQPDPRLSRLFQPSDEHFRGSGFDRGHLVSPSTVAWGESRHANIATRQTFFWANMAPQAPAVNRFSWLALENGERNLAHERGRVVGFSGPVLAADDPLHSVTDELRGRVRARQTFHLPRAYWKVVASFTPEGHELQVSAYVVANSHERLPPEPRPLAHIEQLTGLAFPGPLRDASPAPDLATPSAG